MPRNPALIPLSHDHHNGLLVALRMKKGGPASHRDNWPADIHKQRDALMQYTREELLPHFALEEEILFPSLSNAASLEVLISEIINEHAAMRSLLEMIGSAQNTDLPKQMKDFGILLEAHIRKEERQLFPMIEELVNSGMLTVPEQEIQKRHDSYAPDPSCGVVS